MENCYATTASVLSELGAAEIPVITVLNKIDKLSGGVQAESLPDALHDGVLVSVKTGEGLDALKRAIADKLRHN
jgi:50S ribosomal subunit-associated GTPase HflX